MKNYNKITEKDFNGSLYVIKGDPEKIKDISFAKTISYAVMPPRKENDSCYLGSCFTDGDIFYIGKNEAEACKYLNINGYCILPRDKVIEFFAYKNN